MSDIVNQVVPLNDIISSTGGGGKLNHLKLKTKTLFAEFRAQQGKIKRTGSSVTVHQ